MWTLLLQYFSVLVALREERILSQRFGSIYDSYRRSTPFIIPFVNIGLPRPQTGAWKAAALIAYYGAGMAGLCLVMAKRSVSLLFGSSRMSHSGDSGAMPCGQLESRWP